MTHEKRSKWREMKLALVLQFFSSPIPLMLAQFTETVTMAFHLYKLVELEISRDFPKWTSWMSSLYMYYLLGFGTENYACGKTSWKLHYCFLFPTLLPHLPSSHLPTFTSSYSISARDWGVEKASRFQVMNTSSSKDSATNASNIILSL